MIAIYFFRCQGNPAAAHRQVFISAGFSCSSVGFFHARRSCREGASPHGRPVRPHGPARPAAAFLGFARAERGEQRCAGMGKGCARRGQSAGGLRLGLGVRPALRGRGAETKGTREPPAPWLCCLPSPGAAGTLAETIHLFRRDPAAEPRQIIAGIKIKFNYQKIKKN